MQTFSLHEQSSQKKTLVGVCVRASFDRHLQLCDSALERAGTFDEAARRQLIRKRILVCRLHISAKVRRQIECDALWEKNAKGRRNGAAEAEAEGAVTAVGFRAFLQLFTTEMWFVF